MEDLGTERIFGRQIRLFELARWEWEEPRLAPFTLLVAARALDDELTMIEMRRFAADAIEAGCGYVCTWGEGCEVVHDLFDEASIAADRFVMSTWHDDEPLADALSFSLTNAFPDENQFPTANTTTSAVVLAIEEPWVEDVRRLVADQDELARLWVAEDE